jgi:hypothetical protein
MAYLRHYYEPDNTTKKTRMQQQAKAYQIVNNNLYKASVLEPVAHTFCIIKFCQARSALGYIL